MFKVVIVKKEKKRKQTKKKKRTLSTMPRNTEYTNMPDRKEQLDSLILKILETKYDYA